MATSLFVLNPEATKGDARRPLNSWMAFRSFYSDVFVGFPQKARSTLLKEMWRYDPFKAKWAILAKAYSVIRDKIGKSNIPLSKFCAMATPKLGIIPPNLYFQELRWTLIFATEGARLARVEIRDGSTFASQFGFTDFTSDDLIFQYQLEFPTGSLVQAPSTTTRPNQILLATQPINFSQQTRPEFATNIQPTEAPLMINSYDINPYVPVVVPTMSSSPLDEFAHHFSYVLTDDHDTMFPVPPPPQQELTTTPQLPFFDDMDMDIESILLGSFDGFKNVGPGQHGFQDMNDASFTMNDPPFILNDPQTTFGLYGDEPYPEFNPELFDGEMDPFLTMNRINYLLGYNTGPIAN